MVTHSLSVDVIGPSDRGTVPVANAAVHQTCATAVTALTFADSLHVRITATPNRATLLTRCIPYDAEYSTQPSRPLSVWTGGRGGRTKRQPMHGVYGKASNEAFPK